MRDDVWHVIALITTQSKHCFQILNPEVLQFQKCSVLLFGIVLWVHAIDASYHPVFLLYTLKDRIMTDYSSIASGTTFAELKIFALKKCRVFDVPLSLQNQFAAYVEQADKSKLAIQQSLDRLELLKKSLMQQYFG